MIEQNIPWENLVPRTTNESLRAKENWHLQKHFRTRNVSDSVRSVRRVWNPFATSLSGNTTEDLERLIEEPFINAVRKLWEKGIATNHNDVWSAVNNPNLNEEQRIATIAINIRYLSDTNLRIFESINNEIGLSELIKPDEI
jgi:hypothetical protein